jgi:glucose/arabinose dehydrogenase/uncharacterized protein (DUF427 family)
MSGSIFQASTEVSVGERDGTVTVYFLRAGDLSAPAVVTYDVTSESATPNVDFTGGSGTVTFQPGQDRVGVTFNITNDALSEATETFVVGLVSIEGGSLSVPRTCRVSILDDENPVVPPSDPPLVSNYDVVQQTLFTNMAAPIRIEFSPVDTNMAYVAEKGGVIRILNVATGQDLGVFLDLSSVVCNNEDRGLMDIALHPDFANNRYFYAFYVVDPPGIAQTDFYGNRYCHVVRYTASEDFKSVVPGSGVVIAGNAGTGTVDINGGGAILFDNPDTASQLSSERYTNPSDPTPATVIAGFKQNYIKVDSVTHAGGALAFGPDGMLYVSTGDGTSPNYADPRSPDVQSLNSMSGKILRIDPITGRGLTDNPFYTAGQTLDANINKVYQYGLRNPFSMTFDDVGRLFITDTGWNAYEELNSGAPGANFGWPWYEGREGGSNAPTSGYRDFPAAQTFYQGVANGTILVTSPYAAFGHDTAAPGFQNQVITGGDVVYDGNRYPAELTGDYFFTNFAFGRVFTIDSNNRQQINYLYTASSEFAPINFVQGPDGYVYYVDLGSVARGFGDGTFGRLLIAPNSGQLVTVSAPTQVTEGANATATVTFSLTAVQADPVTVTYSTLNGRAIPGADFTGASNATVVIPAGQTSVQVAIPIVNDAVNEPTEAFAVTINGAVRNGVAVAASGSRQITILDNDGPPPNLLVNGSLESPALAAGNFGSYTSISGWTAISGGTIELWNALNGVNASAGVNYAELDFVGARDGFFQDVTTVAGQTYALTFDMRGRPGEALTTQGIEVVWNGAVVATTTPTTSANWTAFTVNVTGTGGADRLTIRELQAQGADGLGALLDNFRLTAAGPVAPTVSVAASPASVTEAAGAVANVVFTLSAVQAAPVIITYSTANGTATAGADFTGATNATATIAAGQTSVAVQIPVTDDALSESTETFSVLLNGATLNGAALNASGSAGFSIVDNEPPPPSVSVAASPSSVTEGPGATANIVFTLNAVQAAPVIVTYSTANGSATAGADFTGAANATATIAAGQTSVAVSIPLVDDAINEPTESFSVTLNGATLNGAAIAASGSATVTVADNDGPPPNLLVNGSLEQPAVGVNQFASFASIPGWTAISGGTIELWNAHNGVTAPAGVNFAELDFAGARDGFFQDVTTTAGQIYALTFDLRGRPGFALTTQSVEVVWNGAVVATTAPTSTSAWGSFTVNVTGTGGADRLTIREVQAQSADGLGALLDNFRLVAAGPPAPVVTVSATPATVAEAAGASANIVFTLNAAQAAPVVVTYSTTNGTATAGNDFTGATSATATIPAGQTSVSVAVPLINDIAPEPSETFAVTLNGATLNGSAISATGSATVTITDADPPLPTVSIAATPATVTEGAGATASVTFTLSTAQASPVIVTYSTANGTATAPGDFTAAANATATIAAGQTSATVTLPITNDTTFEPNENFTVALNGATLSGTALPASGTATITISDDDPPPPSVSVSAQPASVAEADGAAANIVFTLNAAQAAPVTVTYSTVNGTAGAPGDFTAATSATVDIPAGQTSVSVAIPLVNDTTSEPNESFSVTLDGATLNGSAIAATGSATVTITDNDLPPASVTITASPVSVTEGATPSATVVFTLNAARASPTIITYSTQNGTATAGADFTGATAATTTIPAGQTSVSVAIPLVNDTINEATESFSVTLDGATIDGAPIAASGSAAITIVDNDPAPAVTIAASPATVTEGATPSANIVFTLNAAQAAPVIVTYSTGNGTATAGSDFTGATNATATIAAGQTSVSVPAPIINDAVAEATESFSVTLNGATLNGAAIAASGSATVTILDNDAPPANLLTNGSLEQPTVPTNRFASLASIPGWTAISGGSIELWNAHNGVSAPNGVNFAELDFAGARDGFFQDVTTVAGQAYTLTFDLRGRAGAALTSQSVEVVWNGAVVATTAPTTTASWGSFSVNVTGTGGADRLTIREVQAQSRDGLGALLDNFRLVAAGPSVSVSASPASVTEGGASANIVFTLGGAQAAPVIVTYSTVNGTATAGADFTGATNATVTIPAGQTSVTVPIAIVNDTVFEQTETFSVVLSGATLNGSAIAATGSATVTVLDNDPAPPNLLTNGSLEQPTVGVNQFASFASIPGWTAISGGTIELWNAHNGVTAPNGANFAELDFAGARDGFFQDVQTTAGQTYTLAFDLRGRPGFALTTMGVEVVWNGTVVATTTPTSTSAWGSFSVGVTGTGGLDRLTIREVSSQGADGLGALVDNFRLTANALALAEGGQARLAAPSAGDDAAQLAGADQISTDPGAEADTGTGAIDGGVLPAEPPGLSPTHWADVLSEQPQFLDWTSDLARPHVHDYIFGA